MKKIYIPFSILYISTVTSINYYVYEKSNGVFILSLASDILFMIGIFCANRVIGSIFSFLYILNTIFFFYIAYTYKVINLSILDAISGTDSNESIPILMSNFKLLIFVASISIIPSFVIYKLGPKEIITPRSIYLLVPFLFCFSIISISDISKTPYNIGLVMWQINRTPMGCILFIFSDKFSSYLDKKYIVAPHAKTNSSIGGETISRVKNIIFVMGESSLSDRYNNYGYKKYETTPNINKLIKDGKACALQKSYSNADMTKYSVPVTFSFYSPSDKNSLLNEKNIIELARDHNYKTFWISSQQGTGPYGRPYGYISEYSNYVIRPDFNNEGPFKLNGQKDPLRINGYQDDSLIPILKQKFTEKSDYNLYVVHIMGSHMAYSSKRDKVDIEDLPNASDYDQSIHHTDRILKSIIENANKTLQDYILIYTSDHGEVVGKGHGIPSAGQVEYRVPFIIFGKNLSWCETAESYRDINGNYMSVMNKYLLLKMMGYEIKESSLIKEKSTEIVFHDGDNLYPLSTLKKE